jgi:hypothetical protein
MKKGTSKDIENLKAQIMERILEMVECAENIDCMDNFEIYLKYVDGEFITKLEFSNRNRQNSKKIE